MITKMTYAVSNVKTVTIAARPQGSAHVFFHVYAVRRFSAMARSISLRPFQSSVAVGSSDDFNIRHLIELRGAPKLPHCRTFGAILSDSDIYRCDRQAIVWRHSDALECEVTISACNLNLAELQERGR